MYTVDITVCHNGFHGDLNETFFVGEVDDSSKKLVQTAYECMMKGVAIGECLRETSCDYKLRVISQRRYDIRAPLCAFHVLKVVVNVQICMGVCMGVECKNNNVKAHGCRTSSGY